MRRSVISLLAIMALAYACGDSSSGSSGEDAGTTPGPTTKDAGKTDAATSVDPDDASADAAKPKDGGTSKDTGTADSNVDTDAGLDAGWPDCLTQPSNVPAKTIDAIWTDNK